MPPCIAVCLLLLVTITAPIHAENFKQLLLQDTASNTWIDRVQISGKEGNESGHDWSVTKTTLQGGKQAGVDLVEINNGAITIRVLPTRGMSILDVTHGDLRLGWDSPVKDIVHPSLIDLESRGGLGWLEGFNEWMVRCGLEFAGHPGTDEFINNTGDTATMDLTLHGKIGNIPASKVEVLIDQDAPYTIRLRGTVYESFFYGPKLKLVTELAIVPGSTEFTVKDTVTNQGAEDQEFQLIYHTNYGAPLLEAGAKVHAAIQEIAPMNDHAGGAIDTYHTYKGPTTGFIEEVYLVHPLADEDRKTSVCLQNKAGDAAASITWSTKELPCLTIWKNTAAAADGYVTGLEPATGFPFNRKVERQFGRVPKLKPNASREFTLTYAIHSGDDEVKEAVERIKKIQAQATPQMFREAPQLD